MIAGFGGSLIGAAIAMSAMPHDVQTVTVNVVAPVAQPAAKKGPSNLQLVFRAGDDTYMKLDDAPVMRVRMKVYERGEVDDWQTVAVGEIEPPAAYAHWLGKTVVVDGWCKAQVNGFAVVSRLKGEPDYAEGETASWTADSIYEHGTPVLAAKLDNCRDGWFARDAELAPVIMPIDVKDEALAKRAREKLFASAPSRDAQMEWENHDGKGDWYKDATIETRVVRHPTTNVTWVSVHGRAGDGCGNADINVWGLYRVEGEELVAVQQRDLGELYSIERLIDLENDGEFELLGTPWVPTDHIVVRASGDELSRLVLKFYGCAC